MLTDDDKATAKLLAKNAELKTRIWSYLRPIEPVKMKLGTTKPPTDSGAVA